MGGGREASETGGGGGGGWGGGGGGGGVGCVVFFFFNDTATTEIYTLSLHDALPILSEIANPTFSAADFDSEDLKTWRKMEQVFCEIEEFINYTTPIMNSWPSVVARFHCLF